MFDSETVPCVSFFSVSEIDSLSSEEKCNIKKKFTLTNLQCIPDNWIFFFLTEYFVVFFKKEKKLK